MVAILSDQREAILGAVRSMYTEVAMSPEKTFHFPTGRVACEQVGYPETDLATLPVAATESFAGVGYPFAVGVIEPGDAVLDIGSGSGTDALLAAARVGERGTVHALDLTEAMLEKLEKTAREAGITNLRLHRGDAEHIPLPDASVDVVTSNGVLNLVPDKPRAFEEIFRVLRPGGYAQIADIALSDPVSEECRANPRLWAECVVGATLESEYLRLLRQTGFETDVLGRSDYFSFSSSPETRQIARSFGAHALVLWAVKPPAGGKTRRSTAWPDADATDTAERFLDPPEDRLPHPADVLEAFGIPCGMLEPMLKSRITPLESGQLLEVRSDEAGARVGIPSWSRLTGHELVATQPADGGIVRYFLRRK